MSTVTLEGITKRFGDHLAADAIDLVIPSGAFTVFVGPSGCGKTTLLRLIAGLEEPDAGRILIDGVDVTHAAPAGRGLAMVFQSYALYPHMSVRDNIGFALKLAGTPKAEIARRVDAVAGTLHLTPYLDRRPAALSGGQRQRVAIGRAIVREPRAFLFDEPLSNLDAALRGQMRFEIRQLQQQLGTTAIYVTHDQAEAMTMADRIVVFRDGRIEQAGAPLELYERPANRFVAGFLGSPAMNFVGGERARAAGAATLGIRPEHLVTADDGWPATVAVVEHMGSDTYLHLRLDDGTLLVMRRREDGHVGDRLTVAPLPGKAHRFDGDGIAMGGEKA